MTLRSLFILAAITLSLLGIGCSSYNHLSAPKTISMYCQTPRQAYIRQASEILARNGYSIVQSDTAAGFIEAIDTVDTKLVHSYKSLTRTWRINYRNDSVIVDLWSVSTREDDSDVKQTWGAKQNPERVTEWVRPIMTSLETACGLGNPLTPR
ncbi:hypothetical protein BH10BAC6_BH10BAC6_04530 [soil metagenome]